METVHSFIPLMILWFVLGTVQTFCALAIAIYRARAVPQIDSLGALAGGAMLIYIANIQTYSVVIGGFSLLVAGWAVFGAVMWSSSVMKAAGKVVQQNP